jgi:hypothetical protein
MGNNKIDDAKKCREIAGNFDHCGDALVQNGAHCPMKHIKGFTRSHWMLSLGKCLAVSPWQAAWLQFWWKTQNTNKNGRLKLKVVRILGGRGHLSICDLYCMCIVKYH